jgi:phosphatidylglycerol:prolipoprotein diacylglycerol transferase
MNAPEVVFPNLGIEISTLPRVAFSIGELDIYMYAISIVLGISIAAVVAVREAKRVGHQHELYYDFLFYAIIASFIGLRLFYVAFNWDIYRNDLMRIFAFREGGLAIFGAIIASFITAIIYTRIKKLDFWSFADVCAPSLILGQAIGRWGNFFNREIFGDYTDSLFAMRYLLDQVNIANVPPSVMENLIEAHGTYYIQVAPAFLYESAWNMLVFIIMITYRRHKKMEGEIVLMYLFGYGLGRFFIEGIRTDQLIITGTGLPIAQVLSILCIVISITIYVIRRKKIGGVN